MNDRRRIGSWSIELDDTYRFRIDDGDSVFWKPGRTVFAAALSKRATTETNREQLSKLLRGADPARRTVLDREDGSVLRHADVLREPEPRGGERWAVYGWIIAGRRALQLGFYFDDERDLDWAVSLVAGVTLEAEPRDVDVARDR